MGATKCDCCSKSAPTETTALNAKSPSGKPTTSSKTTLQSFALSLRSLTGFAVAKEEEVKDDPATQYEKPRKRDRSIDAGGMYVKPHEEQRKFDPNTFKRRLSIEPDAATLSAAEAGEAPAEPEPEKPSEPAPAQDEESDDAYAAKRLLEREARRLEKEERRALKAIEKKERDHQRQMWRMLVTFTLVVIVVLGVLFSGGFEFKFGNKRDRANATEADVVRDRVDGSALLAATAPGRDVVVPARAVDVAESVDVTNPASRTWSPREWKEYNDLMRKVKHDAKVKAKANVREFVKDTHAELGVNDEANEYEDRADVEREETAPGVYVQKSSIRSDASDIDDVLAASEATILAHSLIVDAMNSTRSFVTKGSRATSVAEELALALADEGETAPIPMTLAAAATTTVPVPAPAASVRLKSEMVTQNVEVESMKDGALTVPGITPPVVRVDATVASKKVSSADAAAYGIDDLLAPEDPPTLESMLVPVAEAQPVIEVQPSTPPRRALR